MATNEERRDTDPLAVLELPADQKAWLDRLLADDRDRAREIAASLRGVVELLQERYGHLFHDRDGQDSGGWIPSAAVRDALGYYREYLSVEQIELDRRSIEQAWNMVPVMTGTQQAEENDIAILILRLLAIKQFTGAILRYAHRVLGMSPTELAEITGLAPGTVRSHLRDL